MLRALKWFAPVALVLLAACGSPPEPATPDPASADSTPPADEPAATADQPAAPADQPPAQKEEAGPAPPASEAESLARDFLKSGGRRIGYSDAKKGFAYPSEQRREDGFRLDILFTDQEGRKRDVMEVCDFAECAEGLDELAKDFVPKLAAKLESDGYVAIRGIGWPSGRDELEVSTLGMKLRYANGRLEGLREGKPAVSFGQISAKKPELLALFIVPEAKRLAVFTKPSGDAKGVVQEFYVLKLP